MLVYNYHPTHGYYIDSEDAPPSPEEPGIWLIPPNSTTEEPPETKDNEVAFWLGNGWVIKEVPPQKIEKICPLLRQPCIKELCEWFVPTYDEPTVKSTAKSSESTGKCSVLLLLPT
jgi:hypothetical protein